MASTNMQESQEIESEGSEGEEDSLSVIQEN